MSEDPTEDLTVSEEGAISILSRRYALVLIDEHGDVLLATSAGLLEANEEQMVQVEKVLSVLDRPSLVLSVILVVELLFNRLSYLIQQTLKRD